MILLIGLISKMLAARSFSQASATGGKFCDFASLRAE